MLFAYKVRSFAVVLIIGVFAMMPLASVLRPASHGATKQEKAADPWPNAQAIQAADLVPELGNANRASSPTIVYVGFRTLFEGGHIPGASFHGTASKEDGLADLKKWAASLRRDSNLVIYCGCCPFDHCPNIRPAYTTLRDMGFTHIRVLVLPTNFATDWVEKGFPIQKGI
ncbi:MAG TPA: rhodanese-like domain-containing protein [Candidatus Solibacter sp.]|nr:rhodanese-like domain-containing protein [Candidatus Solibacter sp.]